MKFTKTAWIILIVGVLVIAAAVLGWIYSQQVDRQNDLDSKLIKAKFSLSKLNVEDLNLQKDIVSKEIAQLGDRLKSQKSTLSAPEDNIDATDAILKVARDHRIEIQQITSSGESRESLVETNFRTLSFNLSFIGNIDDIANFSIALSERFPTCLETQIQLSRISGPAPDSTDTPAEAGEDENSQINSPGFTPIVEPEKNFSGSLSLVIYDYAGQ
jgi:hypothetical protein